MEICLTNFSVKQFIPVGMMRDHGSNVDWFGRGATPANDAAVAAEPFWLAAALIAITNFAGLRRSVGRAKLGLIINAVAGEIADLCPDGEVVITGRQQVELRFHGQDILNIKNKLDRVSKRFGSAVNVGNDVHNIEIAIGAAAAPVGRLDDVQLDEAAEAAFSEAVLVKGCCLRDASSIVGTCAQSSLGPDLAVALGRDELFLQYQPKVHVRREQIAGAEALVRWQHPTRGLIMPGEFINLAESMHLIGPMTLWIIRQVIADQKALKRENVDLRMFVNISGQLLGDGDFVEKACRLVRAAQGLIGFEITETSVIHDPEIAIANLHIFAEQGITVAIDDYGAGLSSLTYLKQLPACELKIDKMFITQLTSSNRDPLIVRSTIDLAHALEMEVTAEGVETPAALALLSVMGCDMIQGFLISRPLSFNAFRAFVLEKRDADILETARAQVFRPGVLQRRRSTL